VADGEWVAVLGSSGSGKSTLLHLLGALDRPDRGRDSQPGSGVFFRGEALADLSPGALDRRRSRDFGFVFQFYHLLPELTAVENVLAAAMVRYGWGFLGKRPSARRRAEELLERFGLGPRLGHRPAALSGGERQRTAIARALMNEPAVLLADEPTGNLDRATGREVLDALAGLHREKGQTIVMVTHDEEVAARADRRVRLVDGALAA
jgi:lipoprotein-releasing system ATP-binding protein